MLATIIGALLQFGSGFHSVGLLTLQALADAGDGAILDTLDAAASHCQGSLGTKHSRP